MVANEQCYGYPSANLHFQLFTLKQKEQWQVKMSQLMLKEEKVNKVLLTVNEVQT